MHNFFSEIFLNSKSSFICDIGVIETLALQLTVLTTVITYFHFNDGRDIFTLSITKVFKYAILLILTSISIGLLIYCSFYDIDKVRECILMNTLKLSIFSAIVLSIIFYLHDQIRMYVNVIFHRRIGIINPYR